MAIGTQVFVLTTQSPHYLHILLHFLIFHLALTIIALLHPTCPTNLRPYFPAQVLVFSAEIIVRYIQILIKRSGGHTQKKRPCVIVIYLCMQIKLLLWNLSFFV